MSGRDGLDECSISTTTDVVELHDGNISRYTICPEQVGLSKGNNDDLIVSSAKESATLIKRVLKGDAPESAINIVLLNAGAALYTVGATESISEGVHEARKLIKHGDAYRKLQELQTEGVSLRA